MKLVHTHGEGGLPGLPSPYPEVLDSALHYVRRGIGVVALAGKKPTHEWRNSDGTYGMRCPTRTRQEFAKPGVTGVGITTGGRLNLVVLDVDLKHGTEAERSFDALVNGQRDTFLTTAQVVTGTGGRHYYFRAEGAVGNSASVLGKHIDVRGTGGFVVAPPSVHPDTGKPYHWANLGADPLPAPLAFPPGNGTGAIADIESLDVPPVAEEDPKAVLLREAAAVKVGQAGDRERNDTLNRETFGLAPLVSAGRLDFELTYEALRAAGRGVGLDEREVRATLKSALLRGIAKHPPTGIPPRLGIAQALDEVVRFLKRFVVFQHEAQVHALALWSAHTHAAQAASCTPYVWISSPAPTSGKTRLAEVLELLVHHPIRASDASPSSIFRSIPMFRPTLLLDEIDTVFKAKGEESAEDLRRLINSGFNRGAYVLRTEGKDRVPTKFETYCPKAIIGIDTGAFPDTVAKRSIPIRIHRRTRDEPIERFRLRKVGAEGVRLRDALASWAEGRADELAGAEPDLPDELNDRQQDAWEPLLAIADLAGSSWAKRARDAARYLHGTLEEETTDAVLLLEHIRDAFDEAKTDRLFTGVLLTALIEREEGPWAIWWERAVSSENIKGPGSKLARMLKVFGIAPKQVRVGEITKKGYERSQFEKTWDRYFDLHPTGVSERNKRNDAGSVTRDVTSVSSVPPLFEEERGGA